MAKVVQLRTAKAPGKDASRSPVPLTGEDAIWQDVDIEAMIDTLLVPMMVDAWFAQDASAQGNNDNGEQP